MRRWIALAILGWFTTSAIAEPVDLKLPKGFVAHRLYSVPKKIQGSWVCITFDPKGRLIASDQHGGLYRLTLPPLDQDAPPKIEKLITDLGAAQGMLWAFDSLYVTVNGKAPGGQRSGLYRLRDTTGDDQFDKVDTLATFEGNGEHGPHGLARSPDGGLYLVAGNGTRLPKNLTHSRVPKIWAEDQLLPRQHYRGVTPAPGGWVCRTDPEGKTWELFCVGLRNPYDIDVDRSGNLFTYDSDNERDVGQPWYRPTRICYLDSGGDSGWRTGSGKWPKYYGDSLPPAVEIGKGSPTGICFGYGTKFPQKYQDALFILDWSFGRIYTVHMKQNGVGFTGTHETFAEGTPLPVTDIAVGRDGALYFTTGGRRMDSHLYRIQFNGDATIQPRTLKSNPWHQTLSQLHQPGDASIPSRIQASLQLLKSPDRFKRHAGRVGLELHPPQLWQTTVLESDHPAVRLNGAIALARTGGKSDQIRIFESLDNLDWLKLDRQSKLEMLRAYQLACIRFGKPQGDLARSATQRLDRLYPADDYTINRELSQLLVYLEAPSALPKTLDLLTKGRNQEEQIHYALVLRLIKNGWTLSQRQTYFRWFNHAQQFKGGEGVANNPAKSQRIFKQVLKQIRDDAIKTLSDQDKTAIKKILEGGDAQFKPKVIPPASGGQFVKAWKVADLQNDLKNLKDRNFDRGRSMYHATGCIACHQFAGEGQPIGPDLSGVVARFTHRDILESIIEPSKVVSDQFQQVIVTKTDGATLLGRVVEQTDQHLRLQINPLDPKATTRIPIAQVKSKIPSPISMMPPALINTLNKAEALDLMAYLISRGNAQHPAFK